MTTIKLVIAQTGKEDLHWLTFFEDTPHVLNALNGKSVAEMIVNYIYYNYNTLEDHLIFINGKPFNDLFYAIDTVSRIIKDRPPIGFEFLSDQVRSSTIDREYILSDQRRSIYRLYNEIFGKLPEPHTQIRIGNGSQFIVSRKVIHKRPKEFYFQIVKMASIAENIPSLECLWSLIFR